MRTMYFFRELPFFAWEKREENKNNIPFGV